MLEFVLIITVTIGLDIVFGELPNRIHPTVWIGKAVSNLVILAKKYAHNQRLAGIIITLLVAGMAGTGGIAVMWGIAYLESAIVGGGIIGIILSAIVLSSTISIRSMIQHVSVVKDALLAKDIIKAQTRLAMVVKRKTSNLTDTRIISGLVETIAENTVDGIISPLTYFALGGLPGALAYRAVNTIDAMIGYQSREFAEIGWFGARSDTILNFLPSRITARLVVISAAILRLDWRESLRIMRHDHGNTSSPNAGYPIAAMAGALRIRLEKIGHYTINKNGVEPTISDIDTANKIMLVSSILYSCMIIAIVSVISFFIISSAMIIPR